MLESSDGMPGQMARIVSPRLPEELRSIETALREQVRKRLGRGKVDCSLRISADRSAEGALNLDTSLAAQLIEAAGTVNQMLSSDRR